MFQKACQVSRDTRIVVIPGSVHGEMQAQNPAGPETGIDRAQPGKTPHQQPGRDQQNHRTGDLGDDQTVRHPAPRPRPAPYVPLDLRRGSQHHQKRRGGRQHHRDQKHRSVQTDLPDPRQVRRQQGDQRIQQPIRGHDPQPGSPRRQRDGFRKKLPGEPPPCGSQRRRMENSLRRFAARTSSRFARFMQPARNKTATAASRTHRARRTPHVISLSSGPREIRVHRFVSGYSRARLAANTSSAPVPHRALPRASVGPRTDSDSHAAPRVPRPGCRAVSKVQIRVSSDALQPNQLAAA
jgi:hypothetical protein